jgi:serine/threonine-protein kinase RsbW
MEPAAEGCLTVTVTDHGDGIRPKAGSEGPGLGLPLIAALACQLDIEHEPDRGSRVSMSFSAAGKVRRA